MERSSRRMGRLTAYKTISLRAGRLLRRAGLGERAPARGASRVPTPVHRPPPTLLLLGASAVGLRLATRRLHAQR